MNENALLMDVLGGRRPEKTPWVADLSYLYSSLEKKGELEEKYSGDEGYLRFHQELGAGICFYPPFLWKTEFSGGVSYHEEERNDTRTCEYRTPGGSIYSVEKYLPATFSWAYVKHFVEKSDDLKLMNYVFENSRYFENYEEFLKIEKLWGDEGIATGIAPIPVSPLQKLITRWAGIENTVGLYMDDPDDFEQILLNIQDSEDPVYEIISNSPACYIEFPENLSSEVTGKSFFEKYNMPCYKKRVEQMHKCGKYVGIHIDGTLIPCLPMLEPCGFDVAEAVTPAPVGDVDVEDLRKTAGSHIVIWGGIPGALFSGIYGEDVFEEHVRRVLKAFKGDRRFILGVADQVPPDGLISRVRKIRQMLEAE